MRFIHLGLSYHLSFIVFTEVDRWNILNGLKTVYAHIHTCVHVCEEGVRVSVGNEKLRLFLCNEGGIHFPIQRPRVRM